MKKYDIITLEKQNAVLAMILDCESPFCYLKEICKELEHSNYMGTVIFDELLQSSAKIGKRRLPHIHMLEKN